MTTVAHPFLRAILLADLLLALLVAVLLLIGSGVTLQDDWEIALSGGRAGPWLPDPVGLLLVLAMALPLALRRIAPLPILAVTGAASLAYQAGYGPEPLSLGVLVALYTVAVVLRPVICSVTAALYLTTLAVGALSGWLPLTDDQFYTEVVSIVATVMLGYGIALTRTRATLAEQESAAVSRDHESRMRAAVEQEQARIAREVHDIVAHDVSVMVAQAGAARRVFGSQPQTAADALSSIETVGRDALDGLRRLVDLLRTEPEGSRRSPQPSLDRLPQLLEQVERAGLPVDLVILGEARPLSATVELNAFRIVQEALTNSLKHAGPTRATVVLDYGEESLGVEVRDEGRGDTVKKSAGYGLISMQQRVAMLGGRLMTGSDSGPGFRVTARLPVKAGAP
jgi:signal transduction histidine kinase